MSCARPASSARSARTSVPVPKVLGTCDDATVTGAPFYVMDWVDGSIVDRPDRVASVVPDEASRRRLAFSLVDALAELHRVDIDAVGLGDLGRREDQLTRQIERMRSVWEKTKTRDLPVIDSIHARLLAAKPAQRYTGLVHSDYRPGNVILQADGSIAAILDWELCALGDVLIDVGGLLTNWDEPNDPWPDVWMQTAPTRAGGFPTKRELVERYASRTGFDVSDLDYYRAFNYWRIAVIAEGMKRRYESRRARRERRAGGRHRPARHRPRPHGRDVSRSGACLRGRFFERGEPQPMERTWPPSTR